MRFLFTSGGTGGPLAPLIAVAREIQQHSPHAEIRFLVTNNPIEHEMLAQAGFQTRTFPAGKWRRYASLANLRDIFVIAYAFVKAVFSFLRWRPSIVVSAGGFLSVPVAWAAWLFRIPVVIHQQDITLGLANRLMMPFAQLVTVTFAASAKEVKHRKVVVSGNPVREEVKHGSRDRALKRFGLSGTKPIMLVLGGSSGSRRLNEIVIEACPVLCQRADVVHILGKNVPSEVLAQQSGYHPLSFVTGGLGDLYAAADLVVTRAGISTISELAVLGKPSIVIPMPDTHQEANADYLKRHGAARVLEQPPLNGRSFAEVAETMLDRPEERELYAEALRSLAQPDAEKTIAKEILLLAKGS